MKEKIYEIIRNHLLYPLIIDDSYNLKIHLNLDRLDVIEIIMNIEKEFNIKISDDDESNLVTVGDLIKLVEMKTKDLGTTPKETEPKCWTGKEVFYNIINSSIQFEDIRTFALAMANNLPSYFFSVPASTSGKHHPTCDLGDGGLVRHSINVLTILNHMMSINQCPFTDREKDLLRVAALFHDGLKCGEQDLPADQAHTKFLHPLFASNFIIEQSVLNDFNYNEAKFIADAIITHMGQWNTQIDQDGKLPTPQTTYQEYLHLADFLASRKDLLYDWQ